MPEFDYLSHKNFRNNSSFESIDKSFSIQYLKRLDNKSDTSIRRFFHNRFLASEFLKVAKARTKLPDLIITQIPSLEVIVSSIFILYC